MRRLCETNPQRRLSSRRSGLWGGLTSLTRSATGEVRSHAFFAPLGGLGGRGGGEGGIEAFLLRPPPFVPAAVSHDDAPPSAAVAVSQPGSTRYELEGKDFEAEWEKVFGAPET